ncbi:MAG: hypothetical protein ACMG55_19740, partial [Microcoleus sp.]
LGGLFLGRGFKPLPKNFALKQSTVNCQLSTVKQGCSTPRAGEWGCEHLPSCICRAIPREMLCVRH